MSSSISTRLGLRPAAGIKTPCRLASAGSGVVRQGEYTLYGVPLISGDRFLDKDSGTASGVYIVQAGVWQRSSDWNANDDIISGQLIAADDTIYQITFSGAFELGVTVPTFSIIVTDDDSDTTAIGHNLLLDIPQQYRSGIVDGTSLYDATNVVIAAMAANPGPLFMPAGLWNIDGDFLVPANSTLLGNGFPQREPFNRYYGDGINTTRVKPITLIRLRGAGSRLRLGALNSTDYNLGDRNRLSACIRGIHIDGGNLARRGIMLGLLNEGRVEDCMIWNCYTGVDACGTQNTEVRNTRVDYCSVGIALRNGAQANTFIGCYARNAPIPAVDTTTHLSIPADGDGGSGLGFQPNSAHGWRYVLVKDLATDPVTGETLPGAPGVVSNTANTIKQSICDLAIGVYTVENAESRSELILEDVSINHLAGYSFLVGNGTIPADTYTEGDPLYGAGGVGTGPNCPVMAGVYTAAGAQTTFLKHLPLTYVPAKWDAVTDGTSIEGPGCTSFNFGINNSGLNVTGGGRHTRGFDRNAEPSLLQWEEACRFTSGTHRAGFFNLTVQNIIWFTSDSQVLTFDHGVMTYAPAIPGLGHLVSCRRPMTKAQVDQGVDGSSFRVRFEILSITGGNGKLLIQNVYSDISYENPSGSTIVVNCDPQPATGVGVGQYDFRIDPANNTSGGLPWRGLAFGIAGGNLVIEVQWAYYLPTDQARTI